MKRGLTSLSACLARVSDEADVSNFDPMFTSEAPQVSPTDNGVLPSEADAAFANFDEGAKA